MNKRPVSHRELREAFLNFFEQHGHTRVASASLIPQSDPTLLFTNAGMNQFKKYFLGEETPPFSRATSCQKCVRAGGKHNDLENVGYTARHHTFFEMLGNFSFGDYFKKDAIRYAWDFLTNVIGFDPKDLWITVYEDDDEAFALWRDEVGVPEERILRGDEKDNFWSMGDVGPCGPCSEIHFDQGASDAWNCPDPDACGVFCDCDRYLEVWNLVFMQYERSADGALTPLPNPSIDTGMGLERLAALVQGKRSNYDTDLFAPILGAIATQLGRPYGDDADIDTAMRVIADHARAMTFLIADGVLPDHEGRGYVLRRIMRRAIRYGRKAGAKGPFLAAVCDAVIDEMSPIYAELAEHRDVIERVVGLEEERFGETLDRGLALFAEAAEAARAAGNDTIPGEVVFRLYDTFGFPVDLTALLAREEGLQIDQAGFDECMQQQRERARAARKDTSTGDTSFSELPKTRFTGYDLLEDRGHVIAVEPRGEDSYAIVLDKTPFYAESGGQVADRGTLRWGDHHLTVEDVQKQGDVYVHLARGEQAPPSEAEVQAVVDPWWRTHTMAHHTSTHLLQAALREVLGTHVRQSGSLVEPKRLRFDFSHFAALAPEEQQAIEDIVNEKIRADLAVRTREMPYDEAVASGAMAFFGDKYGATVRVVDIGGWSIELCGGTHVRRTGEIGVFVIDSEASVSAGVRRVEAVTADIALERVRGLEQQLNTIAERLGVPRRDLIRRIDHLLEQVDATERELQRLRQKAAGNLADQLADHLEKIGDIELVAGCVPDGDINALRTLTDQVRNAAPDAIVFLISKAERPALFLSVPDQLADRLPAGQLLREAAAAMGARGGGKATSAQGGGGDPERADAAIEALRTAIQSRI